MKEYGSEAPTPTNLITASSRRGDKINFLHMCEHDWHVLAKGAGIYFITLEITLSHTSHLVFSPHGGESGILLWELTWTIF